MIFHHSCLDGTTRTGQETDCTVCRGLLLEAFRAPYVPPPEPAPAVKAWFKDPRALASLERVRDEPEIEMPGRAPLLAEHDVQSALEPIPAGEDYGLWVVSCSCGFFKSGQYRPGPTETTARTLMQSWTVYHQDHPDLPGDEA